MTRGGIFCSRARKRERRDHPFGEPADGAAGADIDRDDVKCDMAVEQRRIELDVIDPDDLTAMHVDDLLIKQVALEQQHAVRRRRRRPRRPFCVGANRRGAGLERGCRQYPIAARGPNDQESDGVGCSWGATATSRTRPRTAPLGSRTEAPRSSDRATSDIQEREHST